MFQRVLWVSLTQALRSIALVLLPIAFISLMAWATAGSSNGDTTDPMRAALWMWIGAHHIPFHIALHSSLQVGLLSYLPLGALVFPFLAARNGFSRAMDQIERDARGVRLMRTTFSLVYAGLATLLAWAATTNSVHPILYFVPIATIPITWIATSTVRVVAPRKEILLISLAVRTIAVLTGISSLVFAFSLFHNRATIKNLILVLEPGWLGGVLLFLLSVLYIPNAILATLSYLIGPGFAVGTGTVVSALTHRISEIPALPLLGALPTGRHPYILFSTSVVVIAGIVILVKSSKGKVSSILATFALIIAGFAALAFLSSGELFTQSLGTVGVSTWKFTVAIAGELTIGAILAWSVPFLIGKLRDKETV